MAERSEGLRPGHRVPRKRRGQTRLSFPKRCDRVRSLVLGLLCIRVHHSGGIDFSGLHQTVSEVQNQSLKPIKGHISLPPAGFLSANGGHDAGRLPSGDLRQMALLAWTMVHGIAKLAITDRLPFRSSSEVLNGEFVIDQTLLGAR